MTRWIADYEVESHASLSKSGEKLIYKHPTNDYEVHISDLSVGPGLEKQLLSVQILFEENNIDLAYDKAKILLNSFLDLLSFVTSLSFKNSRLLRIIDWSKGLKMRKAYQYLESPDPQVPFQILDNQVLESIAILSTKETPHAIWKSLRWYAVGIRSSYSDDQFQFFWFALEILAQFNKSVNEVPDLCPRCKTELYCGNCKTVSTHRPYPKQAIRDLIFKTVKGDPEKTFEILNAFRNCLLHGEDDKRVEKEQRIKLNEAVDILGKTVWTALVNSFKALELGKSPTLIAASTYAHKKLVGTADIGLSGSDADIDDPKIENFRGLKMKVKYQEGTPPVDKKKE